LKIDKSFVQQLIPDSSGELAVRATSVLGALIDIGKNLGLRVVAKGVETAEQRALLRLQQCGAGQGYYFSRPLVPERFAQVLENEKCNA
jgi:EAL domain-containing protein (putative c-di-GMP-specific phosphodiesterase class I)